MGQYKISDFKIGDQVYHLSNMKVNMVAIQINESENLVSCRWMDSSGKTISKEFMPEELGKKEDLKPPSIRISSIRKTHY